MTDEPFAKVEIDDFTDGKSIPEFDNNISWKHKTDRIPRRRVTSSRSNSRETSPEKPATWEKTVAKPTSTAQPEPNTMRQRTEKPLRIPSWKSTGLPRNKKQNGSTMDSCHSSDMNEVLSNKKQHETDDMNITQ